MRRFFEISAEQVESTWAPTAKPAPYALGDVAYCNDHGRVGLFRFSKNYQGSALSLGHLLTMPNISATNFEQGDLVYTAATKTDPASVVGDTDAVATAVTENEYAGLIMAITLGTGVSQFAQIIGNKAATADTHKLTCYLSRSFTTSLDTTDDYGIIPLDHCVKVTEDGQIVTGVAPVAVASTYYFWRQIAGLCFVILEDGVSIIGTDAFTFGACDGTDGEGLVRDADGDDFDSQPDFTGITIIKKNSDAHTPAVAFIRCLASMPF